MHHDRAGLRTAPRHRLPVLGMLRLGSAQPCRYSHYDLRIDLMTNPINRALTAFDEFIAAWLGPAAQRFVFTSGNTHAERVREAIRRPGTQREIIGEGD